jgi:outer membrane protein assembly factor BamB
LFFPAGHYSSRGDVESPINLEEQPMTRTIQAVALMLLAGMTGSLMADAPVGWRNDGSGQFPSAKPPSEWGRDKNVLWKVALPGSSYGAPIVVGEQLFVVSDPAELLCINRADGKVVWKKSISDVKASASSGGGRGGRGGPGGRGGRPGGGGRGGMGGRGAGNTAATPVSDGKHVGCVLGNGVVAVYDLQGKRLWGKYIESGRLGFGHAASPVLLDNKLIVHFKDLVALDVATGKEAWRVSLTASHASPIGAKLGKENVVISPAGAIVRASDGKVLSKGKFRTSQASPILSGNILCTFSRDSMEAVKLSQSTEGDITVTSLWSSDGSRERHQLPSPLAHDGLLYAATTSGFLNVVDLQTGKEVYRQRLGLGQVYSSVTLAGNLLYVVDLRGKSVVFKPGRKFERISTNELEGTGSCPVFAGEHLYLRGTRNLYCLSSSSKAKESQ